MSKDETYPISQEVFLPPKASGMAIWAEISGNDEDGICIDGIKKGEKITIRYMSGVCSFTGGKTKSIVKSVASVIFAIAEDGVEAVDDYYNLDTALRTVDALKEANDTISKSLGELGGEKHRDAWGEILPPVEKGSKAGEFARCEGGIMVCMPKSAGPIKATSPYWLKPGAKKEGRFSKYYSDKLKSLGGWFPSRIDKYRKLDEIADRDGVVTVLPFDSKFDDNSGVYTVKILVTRAKDISGNLKVEEEIVSKIQTLIPFG